MTYDATAWSKHCSVECLQGSYDQLGWDGPGAYRQALADAVTDCLHEVYVQNGKPATVLCAGLLIHVEDADRVVRECARAAKRFLVLGVGVHQGEEDWKVAPDGQFIDKTYGLHYLDRLLRELGELQSAAVYEGGQAVFVVRL